MFKSKCARRLVAQLLIVCLSWPFAMGLALADLRSPAWYNTSAPNASLWHYRVPINVPAGARVNSTVKVDVDFAALFTQMGVVGTLDVNSPRVVRSTGVLATNQEFTDSVYAGATDPTGNGRGEVRFILQDAGAVTYYLYFDMTANGAKAVNPQTPINGNFEQGGAGTTTAPGWTAPTKSNAAFDAQIRPSETPSVTTDGNNQTQNPTDGTPNTGNFSYLVGARTNNEAATANPAVTLTKTIVVPAGAAASNLTIRYRPEGWDSSANGSTNYDFLRIQVIGSSTVELVGPTAGNYTTFPFSPNLNASAATATASGYGQYNGWDTDTTGTHRSGMTIARGSQPWFTRTYDLAPTFAGQTITLSITSRHTTLYKSWTHIDDVEWAVVTATLGTPEGFGTNITLPTGASSFVTANTLSITAQMDAQPTGPVTANVYDNSGTLVASGIILYNNGTNGDATANDTIWSNNAAYTFTSGWAAGNNWLVRVFAKDASTSGISVSNGLIDIPPPATAAETQANFYNIDEQKFTVSVAQPMVMKTLSIIDDPVNGATNPKFIPGANVVYTITVSNLGSATIDNGISISDPIPANTELFIGSSCGAGAGPVAFTPGTSGLSYTFTSLGSGTDGLEFYDSSALITPACGGYAPSVARIVIKPTGTMAAAPSSFSLTFQVRVK